MKMLEMIFRQGYLYSGEWWIHNLFHNIKFAISEMPKDTAFLESMLKYIDALRRRGIMLNHGNNINVDSIITHYRPLLVAAPDQSKMPKRNYGLSGQRPRVMFTVTTCKRFDLFEQTVNSILKNWLDLDKVDYFFCVDDNSSKEDRLKMQTQYPFFNYHMKSTSEKGHRESMNVIWNKVAELKPEYLIHMEDDWLFFKQEKYVGRAIAALEKYESQEVHQIVFNREYGLMMSDMQRVNVAPLGPREEGLCLHIKKEGVEGPNCAYWPHYSLQPSVCRASKILELGDYTSPNQFFERDYADKYHAKGYQTAFFDSILSLHIGKQSWEKEGQNAYSLNQVGQFKPEAKGNETMGSETTVEITVRENNVPLQGTMAQHLEQILKKVETGTPFGLIRPSDGEYKILKNETLTNLDSWTFKEGGKLRGQLAEAIKTIDQNLYIGIPCNTCNKPWNCTDKIYNDFLDMGVPLAQRTYANLVGNSNWPRFSEFMKAHSGFYMITSGHDTTQLPIKELYTIDGQLVDNWDTVGDEETARLLRFIKGKKGLFCFSAGPISKVWIPMCMKLEPGNIYMDVGASLDIFTKGTTNRLYTNKTHSFSKEQCIFKDSIPDVSLLSVIPSLAPMASQISQSGSRNLVYLGVFFNRDYLELLKILLISVKLFSPTALQSIDFLIMTSSDFASDVQQISEDVGVPLKLMFLDTNRLKGAAFARLYIFEYEHIMSYEKILYLDTDIVIQGNLMNVFEEPLEDKLYAMKEGTIEHEIHGGRWFDFSKVDKNTVGINSGILLFKATETMKGIFSEIIVHVDELRATGKPMPSCEDQAFINYHFIKADKYDNKLMEKYGLIYCIDPPPPPSAPTDVVICHFVWPIGNAKHKLGRMRPHLTHLLKNYASIYNESNNGPILLGISYTWGSYGWIRFEANSLLVTKWCQGSYEWVGTHSLYASWAGITHFLRFSQDYSSFMSVRLGDNEYVKGKKQMIFLDEHGRKIDINNLETVEQSQAEHYITEDLVVLELGARYGTVSCVINKKLKNKANQVSVEPDSSVWDCLEKNMKANDCKFNLIKGVISKHSLKLVNEPYGYGNTTIKSESSEIPKYTLDQVEQQYKLKFDTLVADCEGFLGQFFEENPRLYEQLNLVIFEKDNPANCNYTLILENLKSHGFTNLVSGFHEVWKKV
jgi:FkbM family methyltransferase